MATNTAGDAARVQPRQVVNTWRKQINYNDGNNGNAVAGVVVPQGAFIFGVFVEVVTTFDGTPSLLIGTNGSVNNIVAAADVNEAVAGVYEATRGYGRSLASAGDVTISTKLSSTNPMQGQAEILIVYEGNTG